MEFLKEFIKPLTDKFMSNQDLEYKANCNKFCKDLETCIYSNKSIRGTFDITDLSKSRYYNFFEFDEYKKISKYGIKEITFSPCDITYPYNRYYSITNNDGKIIIKFDD